MNKRNLILAAVMVVAVVIGYVAVSGKYPPKDGTQGAIGAANRYQAQQISGSDVSLKDAKIQAFLQTDVFHKVATNPKFRAAVTNPKFQAIAKSQGFQKLSGDPGFAEYLGKYKDLLERADFDAMLTSKKLQNVAEMEKMVGLLQNKNFQKLASDPEFVALLRDPNFDAMMEQAEAQNVTSVAQLNHLAEMEKSSTKLQNLAQMEKKNVFVQLLSDDVLQEAASQGELQNMAELLESTAVETMFSDASFQELLQNPKALAFLTSDEMASFAESLETMSRDGGSPAELLSIFSDPGVADAFQHVEMQEMANADLLASAVAAVDQ